MKITNELRVLAVNGHSQDIGNGPVILIQNDSLYRDRVVIVLEGQTFSLLAEDLQRAIRNATNWRF